MLESASYGTHSMRRTKAAQIYRKTGNLRAVGVAQAPQPGITAARQAFAPSTDGRPGGRSGGLKTAS